MDELYAREAAVPQSGAWALGTAPVGNIWIQQRVVGYNGPEEGQKAVEAMPFQKPPFFHDLHLEFLSIPEALLCSIVNNTIRPINVMKLSTECSEGKADKDKEEDLDLANIKGVNHLLYCFTIYSSILFQTILPGVQSPLIAAFLIRK